MRKKNKTNRKQTSDTIAVSEIRDSRRQTCPALPYNEQNLNHRPSHTKEIVKGRSKHKSIAGKKTPPTTEPHNPVQVLKVGACARTFPQATKSIISEIATVTVDSIHFLHFAILILHPSVESERQSGERKPLEELLYESEECEQPCFCQTASVPLLPDTLLQKSAQGW